MKRYTVRSTFKDAKGHDLFHSKTFDGTAEDARCALVDAHAEMARLGAADGRVDSISSIVKGPNEEISTTDYLDELGSGASTGGLMHEVTPEQLERVRTPTIDPARDGFAPGGLIGSDEGLYGDGIGANRATGGVVQSHDTFRGSDGRDNAKALRSDGEGLDAPLDSAPVTGGPTHAPAPGWIDPSSNPLADIIAGKRRIARFGDFARLTPIEEVTRLPKTLRDYFEQRVFPKPGVYNVAVDEIDFKGFPYIPKAQHDLINARVKDSASAELLKTRKTVGDIIKESWDRGGPTLHDFSGMTKADKRALLNQYKDKYEAQTLGRWADEEETDNE